MICMLTVVTITEGKKGQLIRLQDLRWSFSAGCGWYAGIPIWIAEKGCGADGPFLRLSTKPDKGAILSFGKGSHSQVVDFDGVNS